MTRQLVEVLFDVLTIITIMAGAGLVGYFLARRRNDK